MKYSVLIEETGNGYGGYVLDVPGLHAAGDSPEEVRSLLAAILKERIAEYRTIGKPIPSPKTLIDTIEVG